MIAQPTSIERAWAQLIPRGIAGFMFVFAGANKVFSIGPLAYADRVHETSHLLQFFSPFLIYHVAAVTGFAELIFGAMLLLGIKTRLAARALGAMMVLVTAGYGLAGLVDPVGGITAMDVRAINNYIIPRVALIILVLVLPEEDDLFSVTQLLSNRTT